MGYCQIAPGHPFHGPYHDREYGFPQRRESVLFERLALEINQAGLSWLTVLKKRTAFRAAFAGFNVDRVAAYGSRDRSRLLADAGIIRNRLKVDAVIENARRIAALRESHGSFARWLDAHHPQGKARFFENFEEAAKFLAEFVEPGDLLLLKGSRGVKMEKILEAIDCKHKRLQPATAGHEPVAASKEKS